MREKSEASIEAQARRKASAYGLPCLAASLIIVGCCLQVACIESTQYKRVTERMTWKPFNPDRDPQLPEFDVIELWFVRYPGCRDVVSAKGLRSYLESTGQNVIDVEFSVWGTRTRGVHGYGILHIAGKGFAEGRLGASGGCGGLDSPFHDLFRQQ